MWFIGVEVEQETSAPPPKKNPGSAPDSKDVLQVTIIMTSHPPANFKVLSHQQRQLTNWQWLFFSHSHEQSW